MTVKGVAPSRLCPKSTRSNNTKPIPTNSIHCLLAHKRHPSTVSVPDRIFALLIKTNISYCINPSHYMRTICEYIVVKFAQNNQTRPMRLIAISTYTMFESIIYVNHKDKFIWMRYCIIYSYGEWQLHTMAAMMGFSLFFLAG